MQWVDSGKFEQLNWNSKQEEQKHEQEISQQLKKLDLGVDKIEIEGFEE